MPELSQNLEHLLAAASPKVGQTLFIAIDGHGGSGKTTLAELLSKSSMPNLSKQTTSQVWEEGQTGHDNGDWYHVTTRRD